MRIVSKKPSWKHITFKTPKIGFSEWAKNGVTIRIKDDEYIFRSPDEIHQLNVCINPSFHGNDSCYITVAKLESLCHIVEVQSAVTKKYKDKVKEVGSNQFVFTRKEYDKAMYSVDALLQNDVWQQLTYGAALEQPGFDIVNGYPFRAKADILGADYVADLKTCSDLKAFPYSARKYNYDVQVYLYCSIFKVPYNKFFFFVIDKSSGDLGYYDVSEEFYNSGKEKVEYALRVYETYFVKQEQQLNEYIIKGTL